MIKAKTKRELSCGAILYTIEGNSIGILLLEQDNAHYKRTGPEAKKVVIDIGPSGQKEQNEGEEEAARREIYEETGLNRLRLEKGFRKDMKYEFDAEDEGTSVHVIKTRRFWCARLPEPYADQIRISAEHRRYWIEPLERALQMKELEESKKEVLRNLRSYLLKITRR